MNWAERYAMSRPRKDRGNPPVIRAQCGTRHGYNLHGQNDENSCKLCLEAVNDYANQRNRDLGVPEFQPAEHGTNGRYMRHLREEGVPVNCPECLQAHNEHVQWYNLSPEMRQQALTSVQEGEA